MQTVFVANAASTKLEPRFAVSQQTLNWQSLQKPNPVGSQLHAQTLIRVNSSASCLNSLSLMLVMET